MVVNNAFRRIWNRLAWAHAEIDAWSFSRWAPDHPGSSIELRDGGYCRVLREPVVRPDLR